jgi:DNA-directed RNA polymerase I, II, and III subunit RPABC1
MARIGRIKKNVCIMLQDRGYNIQDEDLECLEKSDMSVGASILANARIQQKSIGQILTSTFAGKDKKKILLLFIDVNYDEAKRKEKMISSEQTKAAVIKWKQEFSDCDQCVLVSPTRLSPDAKREIIMDNLSLISQDFLLVPVGRHKMVPKHTALTSAESQEFLMHRKILLNQLPHLKKSDPISAYYGFSVGTIVKIDRPGNIPYFRVVVDS